MDTLASLSVVDCRRCFRIGLVWTVNNRQPVVLEDYGVDKIANIGMFSPKSLQIWEKVLIEFEGYFLHRLVGHPSKVGRFRQQRI